MAKADKAPVTALAQSPSHLLHRVLQLALDIYTEETGKGALTQRQYAVLAACATTDGASQTDLVNLTGIDRSTLADMVARMIEKGWLGRERSKTDARAKTVRLTDKGAAALNEIAPKVAAADERILANLVASRRSGFVSALAALAQSTGEETLVELAEKKKKKVDKASKSKVVKLSKLEKPKAEKKKKKKAKKLHAAE
jgi:DNA-binding MarR family transcriptional regulator